MKNKIYDIVINRLFNGSKILLHIFSIVMAFAVVSEFLSLFIPFEYISMFLSASLLVLLEGLVFASLNKSLEQSLNGIMNVSGLLSVFSISIICFSALLTTVGTGKVAVSKYKKHDEKPLKQTETRETKRLKKFSIEQSLIVSNIQNIQNTRTDNKGKVTTYLNPTERLALRNASKNVIAANNELLSIGKRIRSENEKINIDNSELKSSINEKALGFGFALQIGLVLLTMFHHYLTETKTENTPKQEETTVNNGNGNAFKLATLNGIDKPILSIMAKNPNIVYLDIVKKLKEKGISINTGDISKVVKNAAVQGYNYDNLQTT